MTRTYTFPLTKPYYPRSAISGDNLEYWIGRQAEIDRVVRGLVASTGTHYLVTGYPGIGKSSFVARAVSEWRNVSAARGINRLLIFNLHLAQPQTPEEVVKRLIGKVYFASVDGQFAPTKKLAERLELTYINAQSKSVKETQGQTVTSESAAEGKLNLLSVFPGLAIGSKQSKGLSKSLEIQREYNVSMATSDFESVLHLLTQGRSFETGMFNRLRRQLSGSRQVDSISRILFVFDQIDDLGFVEQIGGFLNLPNASFIVLGGPKLQQQVSSARELGIHVLDNFDEVYLNCRWDKADETLKTLIDTKYLRTRKYADYRDYLNFCSQGLPRRLFTAMDRHASRDGNQFYLKLSTSEQVRTRLCADLHRVIWKHRKDILGSYIDSVQHPARDKALRGAYHLTDRIFRIIRFSYQDANTVATKMSATIMHPSRERVLKNLLKVFESYGMIVKDGSDYALSETILDQVKQIPDWLTDGFVYAQDLLEEMHRLDDSGPGFTPRVDFKSRRKRPSKGQEPEKRSDMGVGASGNKRRGAKKPKPGLDESQERDSAPRPPRESSTRTTPKPGPEPVLTEFVEGVTDLMERWSRDAASEKPLLDHRYVIERKLGEGGMSEIYLAHDSRLLNKPVVIKIMSERAVRNEWLSQKFQQEIEALLRVVHPGVVGVRDSGKTPEGRPYIVMDYVEGHNLRAELRSGELSFRRISRIVQQVSNALGAAHRLGIIHRDVKPENIMISELPEGDEEVRLIDFGIAKIKGSIVGTTTVSGMFAGTVAYMSPEQLRGEKITPASDIYALGITTFEMVTGRRPFGTESIVQLSENQRAGVSVLPSSLRPKLPRSSEQAILKALNFDPKKRYQHAQEFAAAFIRALK